MIQFKGIDAGTLKCVIPDVLTNEEVEKELDGIISSGNELLTNCHLVLEIQKRKLTIDFITLIINKLAESGNCTVLYWNSDDEDSKKLLLKFGMKLKEDYLQASASPAEDIFSYNPDDSNSKKSTFTNVILGNLRNGQKIEHNGDVIIIGNVNRGAEVIATGNITVLGHLRGIVHAGCNGNSNMCVIVRLLETGQIRIGSKVAIIGHSSKVFGCSATVKIKNNEIQVVPWPVL